MRNSAAFKPARFRVLSCGPTPAFNLSACLLSPVSLVNVPLPFPKGMSAKARAVPPPIPDSLQASPLEPGPHRARPSAAPAANAARREISDGLALFLSAAVVALHRDSRRHACIWCGRARARNPNSSGPWLGVSLFFSTILPVSVHRLRHGARHHHRHSRHGAHPARRAVRRRHCRQPGCRRCVCTGWARPKACGL